MIVFFNSVKSWSSAGSRSKVLVLAKLFAIAQPVLVLIWSSVFGRLSYAMGYDDVNYANDILNRIEVLKTQGLLSFAEGFISDAPHSPLSFFLGIVAMPIFGITDLGFYAGNALAFWFVAIIGYRLIKSLFPEDELPRASWLFVFGLSPVGISVVSDSRPDVFYGVSLAITSVFVARYLSGHKDFSVWFIALLITLSLASKPTAFLHTFFILGICFLYGLFRVGFSNRSFWKSFLKLLGCLSVLSTPLIAIEFNPISRYLEETVFGNQKSIWQFSEDINFFELLVIFLDPTWQRFGGLFSILGLVLAAYFLLIRRTKSMANEVYFLLAAGLSSFLLVVSQGIKNEFFFIFAHSCALILISIFAGFSGRAISKINSKFHKPMVLGTPFAICLIFWISLAFIAVPGYPDNKKANGEFGSIMNLLEENRIQRIFFPTVGAISSDNVFWETRSRGLRMDTGPLDIRGAALMSELDQSLAVSKDFDEILFPNLVTANYFEWLPSTPLLPGLLARYLEEGYRPIKPFSIEGSRYFLLSRTIPSANPIPILSSYKDLGPKLVFQHNFQTHEVREILDDSFSLCWNVFEEGDYRVKVRTLEPVVLKPSKVSGDVWSLVTGDASEPREFSAKLNAGRQCLEIEVVNIDKTPLHLVSGVEDATLSR